MGVVTETLKIETGGAVSSLHQVEDGFRRTHVSAKEAADTFGDTNSNLMKLTGTLDLIVPGAGQVVTAFADLADVGEVASVTIGGLGVSMGALLTVLGPVVAVVGAVAYAYSEWNDRQEEAAERTATYIQSLSSIKAGFESLSAALDDLETREGILAKTLTLSDADAEKARRQAEQVFAKQRDTVTTQMQAEADRLAALRTQQTGERGFLDTFFGASPTELANEEREVRARFQGLKSTLADLDAQQGSYGERLAEVTTGERDAAKATKDHAKAVQELGAEMGRSAAYWFDQLRQVRAAEEAYKEIQMLVAEGQLAPGRQDIRKMGAGTVLDEIMKLPTAAQVALAPMEDLQLKQADLTIAFDRGLISLQQYTEALARLQEAMIAAGRTGNPLAMQLLGSATSSLGVLGGGLLGGIGMLGPQGAAIAGLLGGLQTVGSKGASGVSDEVNGLFDDLTAAMEALPQILGEVLPEAFEKGVPALVEATIKAAPEIAVASVKAQALLFKELVVDLPSTIGEAFGQALREWWADATAFFRDPVGTLFGGSGNTFWEKAQNTVVDIGRGALYLATFSGSEYLYGAANGASGGAVQKALYAGDREDRARSARHSSPWGAFPGPAQAEQRLSMQLGRVLNDRDRRNNLTSSTGIKYRPDGPTRV